MADVEFQTWLSLTTDIKAQSGHSSKEQEEFGYGKAPSEVTEKQQQACVSASATVGALFTVHLQAR